MQPVVTPAEMAAIDHEAPEPVEELIERAGWATARAAKRLLGPSLYGKRVAVLVGKGNNGADGRSAARYLERDGARCTVFEVSGAKPGLIGRVRARLGSRSGDDAASGPAPGAGIRYDLVIDACFGTGLRRDFDARTLPVTVGDQPVLAVDIPSGVDGSTGELRGHPLCATATVTFAALKPGLLLDPGRRYTGDIEVADIGLDCSRAMIHHLERGDIAARWPRPEATTHKWRRAVYVVGGGPGMTGAPALTATAALRSGAGYAVVSIPAADSASAVELDGEAVGRGGPMPIEVVAHPVPARWAEPVLGYPLDRFGAAVIGPGLDTTEPEQLARFLEATSVPAVLDAGAFDGLAQILADSSTALRGERTGRPRFVLTPHDGEYERLFGQRPGHDRISAARHAAERTGAVVLLKGPTTAVADPDGRVLLSTAADQRLATAGSGDVLAGVIGAAIAGGLDPFYAAGVGAELHGRAGIRGYRVGLTAGDLPSLIAAELSEAAQS